MKYLTQAPVVRKMGKWGKLSVSASLLAASFVPAGLHAQLIYNAGTAEVEFDAGGVINGAQVNPVWTGPDGFTGFNDILDSPGGGFNSINYNAFIGNTGVQNMGAAFGANLNPGVYGGVGFGGGSMVLTPGWGSFAIGAVAPGSVSVVLGAESANYTVGAAGLPNNIGTVLAFTGGFNANDAVAVSMVTYINDTTKGQSATLAEVVGASFVGNSPIFTGAGAGLGIPLLNGANGNVIYANGNTTFAALAAASTANFMAVGDNVDITSVFTVAADPQGPEGLDSYIDSSSLPDAPSLLSGVTLPGDILDDTAVPEPGTLSLLALGLTTAAVAMRRRLLA